MRSVLLAALTIFAQAQTAAPPPPDTEIFLAPLSTRDGALTVGAPANITNSPGYDNQPSFMSDGRSILFTSIRGSSAGGPSQTDIYRYDISSGTIARVTSTPDGEYSPTVTPDGAHISVIRQYPDTTQELWQLTMDGAQRSRLLTVKPVGYHAWIDDHTVALFILGQPATLQLADTRSDTSEIVARGIGRSLLRIPHGNTISFVERSGTDATATLAIRELDPKTRRVTPLVDAVAGAKEADCAWTPDGMLLMAEKDVLYGWRRGDGAWRRVADLAALGLHGVSRLAVSPSGDRIAIVSAGPRQ
jgi:WD40-like Beta Propeller Repeat